MTTIGKKELNSSLFIINAFYQSGYIFYLNQTNTLGELVVINNTLYSDKEINLEDKENHTGFWGSSFTQNRQFAILNTDDNLFIYSSDYMA